MNSVNNSPPKSNSRNGAPKSSDANLRISEVFGNPPHCEEAEQGVIGCILLEPQQSLDLCVTKFPAATEVFYIPQLQNLYDVLVSMRQKGALIDVITIQRELTARNELEQMGGVSFIAGLMNLVPSAASLEYYVEIVIEVWQRRVLREKAIGLLFSMTRGDVDAETIAKTALAGALTAMPTFGLPPILSGRALLESNISEPEELIWGMLHRGTKLVLGGPSKSRKTFSLMDLGVSVAHGEPFWSMKTTRGRVLYVNLEIPEAFFRKRLSQICRAKRIEMDEHQFDAWNLRGRIQPFQVLLSQISASVRSKGYALIILDPLYKLLGNADENSARDINALLNAVETLSVETGAAIVFGAHFAKGNASGKESMDRISGSGVFARDPDSILTLTPHETDNAYTVEATLRNFKPLPAFVIRWDYPLMRRDDSLNPTDIKKKRGGRQKENKADELLEKLSPDGLTHRAWLEASRKSKSTFERLRKELLEAGRIKEFEGKWLPVPKVPESCFGTN